MTADREPLNFTAKNKKDEHPGEADSTSESIPRFHQNNINHNPGKGKQKKTAIHRGNQSYCAL